MQLRTIVCAAVLAGCGGSQPAPSAPTGGSTEDPGKRPALDRAACEARNGSVVGDIGDGATQRPDYVCPSGKPPLGAIAQPAQGPVAVEGEVCCPR